ncbi:uncharacterized protein LOC135124263 [Zophobas morio]|uniref:uncharacterized protein LOC135124263 n=1 Tax=Zophobas morio TaxID=2755281 RepID=UPI003082A888
MSASTVLFLAILLCPFFVDNVDSASCYDPYVTIKWSHNGMVLDASEEIVHLRNVTQTAGQLWKLRHRCDGTFYIFNSRNGCGLAIRDTELVTSCSYKSESYYWYINWDGSIVNFSGAKMAIDVAEEHRVLAAEKDGSPSQKFEFSCVCCPYCFMFGSSCC